MNNCCHRGAGGPGYATPLDAYTRGPREQVLFVTCVNTQKTAADYLATVDVSPDSPSYGRVVQRCYMTRTSDELHHSGWNACSSCFDDPSRHRDRLILPSINSSRIYIVRVDAQNGTMLDSIVEPEELARLNVSGPHTSHCLPSGHVMVSCLGDAHGEAKGSLVLLDGQSFKPLKVWNDRAVPFGYDFWYQPRADVLVSTEWTSPNSYRAGYQVGGVYGSKIHFWQWSSGQHVQTIDLKELGEDNAMPLEVRFLHDPAATEGYVGLATSSNVIRFWWVAEEKRWRAAEVIRIQPKQVEGWAQSSLPALITDILISLDDRFLFVSCWTFGEVRQYRITDRARPVPVAVVRLGGIPQTHPGLKIVHDPEPLASEVVHSHIKGQRVMGGCQMLQLSLDGRRLYVTFSLHSAWDAQFYPDMVHQGSQLLKIDVDTNDHGGLSVDKHFLVDFTGEPDGPILAHEMRYPGGDCTSDIWV